MAAHVDATTVLEDNDNPFLADFYAERPGAAFQAQLFFLLNRHRQQTTLRQADLFSQATICDYLFEKDRIYAYLNLDDNELFIYQRVYELLARDMALPDLVVYLQAPTDLLNRRRARARPSRTPTGPNPAYVKEAQRGLPALLLPLHGHAAARRRDLADRLDGERRRARRSVQADSRDGAGHALLRAEDARVGKEPP